MAYRFRKKRFGRRGTSKAGRVAKKVARKTYSGLKRIARTKGVNVALKVAANKQGQTTWRAVKKTTKRRRFGRRNFRRRY